MAEECRGNQVIAHLYTAKYRRRWGDPSNEPKVKLLCTGELRKYLNGAPDLVTVPSNVTCTNCLELLIPKVEAQLAKMKKNFEARALSHALADGRISTNGASEDSGPEQPF